MKKLPSDKKANTGKISYNELSLPELLVIFYTLTML